MQLFSYIQNKGQKFCDKVHSFALLWMLNLSKYKRLHSTIVVIIDVVDFQNLFCFGDKDGKQFVANLQHPLNLNLFTFHRS
jgi:hypothetical protein